MAVEAPSGRQITLSMMSQPKIEELQRLLFGFPWRQGDTVVEIGTYHGELAAALAGGLRTVGIGFVPVVSIDPFERLTGPEEPANPHGSYGDYMRNTADFAGQCVAITAPSVLASAAIAPCIGLLIVDGWHSYEACLADLTLYVPKVRPRGFVFVDDDSPAYPGVTAAILDYFKDRPGYELRRPGGYAVARVPDKE